MQIQEIIELGQKIKNLFDITFQELDVIYSKN